MRLGGWEIGLILIIVLIIFGAGKLPQIGGALGQSIKEFRKAKDGKDDPSPQQSQTQQPQAGAGYVQSGKTETTEKKDQAK